MDIALNDTMQLIDEGDEFLEEDTAATDAKLIFIYMKGELRFTPWLGFGGVQKLRSVISEKTFVRELKVELEADSFVNPVVDVTGGIDKIKMYV